MEPLQANLSFYFRRKKELAPLLFLAYLITVRETNSPPKNMTKKHFIAAAKIISAEKDRATAQKMADLIILINKNANFDRKRFLSACGL